MSRRWAILVSAALIIAGVVIVIVLNTGDDDNKTPSQTLPTTVVTGHGLDTGGEALANLLTGARNHTFHAHYAVHGSPKLLGGKLELEWWNTAGRSRIDSTRTSPGSVVETTSIIDGDKGISCQKVDTGSWSCHSVDPPAAGDPDGMIATLTAQLSGRSVSERPGTVDGIDGQCFRVGPPGTTIDVCVNSDGVLLRNATPEVAYVITSLDDNVPDSTFTPPAPVH